MVTVQVVTPVSKLWLNSRLSELQVQSEPRVCESSLRVMWTHIVQIVSFVSKHQVSVEPNVGAASPSQVESLCAVSPRWASCVKAAGLSQV